MPRPVQPPTVDERENEGHPAWGLLGMSRVTSGGTGGGAHLFDSDVQHQHYVIVRLSRAKRRRELHRDWTYGSEDIVEIAMSEAQWASFVSSANIGDGVPVTIRRLMREDMPDFPHEPRLGESVREVRNAATRALIQIDEAMEKYLAHKTVGNLRDLQSAIRNAPANMAFAAESLSEHAENVGQRLRADIEAMVVAKAQQLGIEPGDLTDIPQQLTTGEPDD